MGCVGAPGIYRRPVGPTRARQYDRFRRRQLGGDAHERPAQLRCGPSLGGIGTAGLFQQRPQGAQVRRGLDRSPDPAAQRGKRGLSGMGYRPRDAFHEHEREGINVAAAIEHGPGGLLGRSVFRGAQHDTFRFGPSCAG